MSEGSKNYKSYRTSAILFMISGIVFISLSIIPGRIAENLQSNAVKVWLIVCRNLYQSKGYSM